MALDALERATPEKFSATLLNDAGGKPPSPKPNSKRITNNAIKDSTIPVRIVNTDQSATATKITFFEPILSASHPQESA